jgi:hypothetical protein
VCKPHASPFCFPDSPFRVADLRYIGLLNGGGTSDGSVTQEQAGQMAAFSIRDFCEFCIAYSKQARYNQRKVTTRQKPHSVVGTGEAIAKVRDGHLGGA